VLFIRELAGRLGYTSKLSSCSFSVFHCVAFIINKVLMPCHEIVLGHTAKLTSKGQKFLEPDEEENFLVTLTLSRNRLTKLKLLVIEGNKLARGLRQRLIR
jgi:hypothetical protein